MSHIRVSITSMIIFSQFRRATVQNYKTGELETASYRISKSSWLKSEDSEVVAGVNERIAAITGRSITLHTALPWCKIIFLFCVLKKEKLKPVSIS